MTARAALVRALVGAGALLALLLGGSFAGRPVVAVAAPAPLATTTPAATPSGSASPSGTTSPAGSASPSAEESEPADETTDDGTNPTPSQDGTWLAVGAAAAAALLAAAVVFLRRR